METRISAEDRADLERAYELAQRMRMSEPDRNLSRSWAVIEESAEALLMVYGSPSSVPGRFEAVDVDALREQLREEVRQEFATSLSRKPEPTGSWWERLTGRG